MPGLERPSYAGAHVMILEGLDGRLSVQHDGRIIACPGSSSQPRKSPQNPRYSYIRTYPDS